MTRQFQKPTPDPNAADDDPPHSSHLGNELLARHNLAKKSVLNSLADAQQNSNKAQAGMGCDGMGWVQLSWAGRSKATIVGDEHDDKHGHKTELAGGRLLY